MTTDLAETLPTSAADLLAQEAGTGLLIANGTLMHRDDFTTRLIEHSTSDGTPMAAIDWNAAAIALQADELPCSGGERRIRQLSASLAIGTPIGLRDTITGLDNANISRLLTAIRHAAGKRR